MCRWVMMNGEDDAEEKHKVKGRVDDDEDCVLMYVVMDNEVKG